jgi:hypothetical protein
MAMAGLYPVPSGDRLRVVLRSIVHRKRAERELDEEMQYHLERDILARVNVARPGAPAYQMKAGTNLAAVEAAVTEPVRFSTTRASDGLANRPMSFVSGGTSALPFWEWS